MQIRLNMITNQYWSFTVSEKKSDQNKKPDYFQFMSID